MKIATIIVVCLVTMLALTETALAVWPSGSSGDQYDPCNNALNAALANLGISHDTFISIYNSASTGDVSGYTDSQLSAVCQVLSSLPSGQCDLADYDIVYNNLTCSTRLTAAGPTRAALPSTGIPLALLIGTGVVGIGAAFQLMKRSN